MTLGDYIREIWHVALRTIVICSVMGIFAFLAVISQINRRESRINKMNAAHYLKMLQKANRRIAVLEGKERKTGWPVCDAEEKGSLYDKVAIEGGE